MSARQPCLPGIDDGTELDERYFDYLPGFVGAESARRLLAILWRELGWEHRRITLFGRQVLQPRLTAWYGDEGAAYRYSGLTLQPRTWHPELNRLRKRLQSELSAPFNAVLANAYRDGADSMGWHADDEAELGDDPLVASISLGAERRFLVRRKGEPSTGIRLESGSLLVMKPGCQSVYQHSLPKTRSVDSLRINLTFRNIVV